MHEPTQRQTASTPVKLRVEGMDCGACGIKIENALRQLPGVSDINVNYGTETLSLMLDADRTAIDVLEEKIRSLGYTPHRLEGGSAGRSESGHLDEQDEGDRAWWKSAKGRIAIATGVLLGIAFVIAQIAPPYSFWAYLAAAAVGLVPFARRAEWPSLTTDPPPLKPRVARSVCSTSFLLLAVGFGVPAVRARAFHAQADIAASRLMSAFGVKEAASQ